VLTMALLARVWFEEHAVLNPRGSIVGELEPFCGLCAHREFCPDSPASTDD
jgi:hypothetical protein